MDEGCSSPYRQYQLYLHVMYRNPQRHAVTFDRVGLTVNENSGGMYNPFGWGGPDGSYPSHATPLRAGKTKTVWLPYYAARPRSFSVWWRFVYTNHSTPPTLLARFQAKPAGKRPCGR